MADGGRAAARGANLSGALKRHWINDEYCAIKLRLPHAKGPLRKVAAILARAVKSIFTSFDLSRKRIQNIGSKGDTLLYRRHCVNLLDQELFF